MKTVLAERAERGSRRTLPLVWLCSAGLTTALLGFATVLIVIVAHGLSVFNPKPVVQVTIRSVTGPERVVAGILLNSSRAAPAPNEVWKILTGEGSKAYARVAHLDATEIVAHAFPPDIATADTVIGPPVFFYPLTLDGPERSLSAQDPRFKEGLRHSLRSSNRLFQQIERRQRDELQPLRQQLSKALRERAQPLVSEPTQRERIRLSRLDKRIERLERETARVQSEIDRLQKERLATNLTLRVPDGAIETRPLADFSRIQFTNTMGPVTKTVETLLNMVRFVSEYPRQANTKGGIFPAILSTFVMTLLMSVVVMPFGVIAAIYLREYARQGPFVQLVRIGVNNLAGVPSIVYGVFGLGFFVYILGGSIDALLFDEKLPNATFGTGGILWASLTLALMTVPVVIVATEDALAAVPKGTREASLACGASQLQTLLRVVLPASGPGILTGLILAIARGAGEVAPLMLVGVVKLAPALPLDGQFPFLHLERKFMHLGYHIYDLAFQSPNAEASRPMVFATALLLILLVISLNLAAIIIRRRLKARLQSSIF
jgi:phosphate transport system permease protein